MKVTAASRRSLAAREGLQRGPVVARGRTTAIALAVLVAVYVALGVLYAATTPLFEFPDESSHLQVIRYIGAAWRPVPYQVPERRVDTGPNMAWLVSYHDPPLYYAPPLYHTLGAILTAAISMDDLETRLIPSPSWDQGWAPERGTDGWNKNVFVHLPTETLTGSATVRATAVLRAFSVLLGAVTLLATYGIGSEIWPGRPFLALGAVAWVALNPQFIASNAGVSNDPLTITAVTCTLLGVLRAMRKGAGWRRWAGVGILAGLGMLTKQSALLVLPVGVLAALLGPNTGQAGQSLTRHPARRLGRATAFAAAALLVGGGWYVSNFLRYGDVLGTGPHYAMQAQPMSFGWEALVQTLESYWAAFGWALITAPPWAYAIVGAAAAVAVAGMVRALLPSGAFWQESRAARVALGLLALQVALNAVAFVGWARATAAPYGRLLFPTIGVVGVLLAWGAAQWAARWSFMAVAAFGLCFAVAVPWLLFRPAFGTPYRRDGAPASMVAIPNATGGGVSLLGYEAPGRDLEPGDSLDVVFYWRADAGSIERLTGWVQLGGVDATERVADDTRWLGGTLFPSDLWRQGDVVAHSVTLDIPDWAPTPALYWVRVGLLDQAGRAVPVAETERHATLGPWRVRSTTVVPASAVTTDFAVGSAIRLQGYELSEVQDGLALTLYWHALAPPGGDYTAFVHAMDAAGNRVGQHDGPPTGGAYPTSWWQAGDTVADTHVLAIPHGQEAAILYVGLYDQATETRLASSDSAGQPLPDDAIPLVLGE